MLASSDISVTVKILRHAVRQGTHDYIVELYEDGVLMIGGLAVSSRVEMTPEEISTAAIKALYLRQKEAE
jgi:hypothetical protein